MTEREAWLAMARAWGRARANKYGEFCAGQAMGLCASARLLHRRGRITRRVWNQMANTIYKATHYRRGGYGWAWPRDKAGAKARAEFCLKIAARRGRGR